MRFASATVYLAIALSSLLLASLIKEPVTLVFSAGESAITAGASWMALLALAFRAWYIGTFAECLSACIQAKPVVSAFSLRSISTTQLWETQRAWSWLLIVAEAVYERGFVLPLFAGLSLQGVLLLAERRKGQAIWHKLPIVFQWIITFALLLISLLLIQCSSFEHVIQVFKALIGHTPLDETSVILSAQLSTDFNVLLMVVSTVLAFAVSPLRRLALPPLSWKVISSALVMGLFALVLFVPSIQSRVQGLLSQRLGKGTRHVVAGRAGWLFDQRELTAITGAGPMVKDVTQPHTPESKALDEIIAFANSLKVRGIPLLLVPVPMKATLYPEALTNADPDESPAPLTHPSLSLMYEALAKEGVDVQDITAALMQLKTRHKEVFFKQDSHWTPEAMQEIAKALSNHVRNKYPGLVPSDLLITRTKAPDGSSFGDLAERLYPVPELVVAEESKVLVAFPELANDLASPIVLLGDDYVSIFDNPDLGFVNQPNSRAGFAQHLALYLGAKVDSIAIEKGASTAVRRALACRYDDEVRAKKLVIWLVPVSDLLLSEANGVEWSATPFSTQSSPPQVLEPMVPKRR